VESVKIQQRSSGVYSEAKKQYFTEILTSIHPQKSRQLWNKSLFYNFDMNMKENS
jgi:hypothetical protein